MMVCGDYFAVREFAVRGFGKPVVIKGNRGKWERLVASE